MAHETFSNLCRNAEAMHFAYLIFEGAVWEKSQQLTKQFPQKPDQLWSQALTRAVV